MADIKYILAFSVMLAFASALVLAGGVENFIVFDLFDIGFFSGEIVAITGACVIATGIPCGVALAIGGTVTIIYYVLTDQLLTLIFFTPIVVTIIYILMKLARGTG